MAHAALVIVLTYSMLYYPVTAASEADEGWLNYGNTPSEQRYSPLGQINQESVGRLGLAWSMDLDTDARALEATPLEINGVLYFTASMSVVYAVDAVTGKLIWRYDPEAWNRNARAMRTLQGMHRGVAFSDGAIFVGSSDGRLISLDAKTGKVNWAVLTVEEGHSRRQISGAPRIFKGKVIIGNSGADLDLRGYITAYDAKTGKQAWRFYTVPGNPALGFEDNAQRLAAKTWTGDWWRFGGGGNPWNSITFDPELSRIYIGTGNAGPWSSAVRSPHGGDNWFVASIVALDADTGEYIWHYQTTPGDVWDYDACEDIILADLTVGGLQHKALMQANKNGFFYVLDRSDGHLLSAGKTGKVTWADRIDLATGRPVVPSIANYEKSPSPVTLWPGPWGTHNWQAMAFSPRTGLAYIPYMQWGGSYSASKVDILEAKKYTTDADRFRNSGGSKFGLVVGYDPDDGKGQLIAWDPISQKARWRVRHGMLWNGGAMVTASNLVFQGTAEGWLYAYDAESGRELWKFYANNGISAPPISYSIQGRQYVTVLAGYGPIAAAGRAFDAGWRYGEHPSRVLTFALDANAKLPPAPGPDFNVETLDDPSIKIDPMAAQRGRDFFNQNNTCAACHGPDAATPGTIAPDLRKSHVAIDPVAFRSALRDGTLRRGGMPLFDDLSNATIDDLYMFIRQQARAQNPNFDSLGSRNSTRKK